MAELRLNLTPYVRTVLVILGWGTSLGAVTLWIIFQGLLLPFTPLVGSVPVGAQNEAASLAFYYTALFLISVVSPMGIRDVARSIGGFIFAYILGGVITYEVISLPAAQDTSGAGQLLVAGAVRWTFSAMFPIPLFLIFLGTILGAGLTEHFGIGEKPSA